MTEFDALLTPEGTPEKDFSQIPAFDPGTGSIDPDEQGAEAHP